MQSTLIPPFENKADADAAYTIYAQLGDMTAQLQLIEFASRQFPDAPSGLLGLLGLMQQVFERWQEYYHVLSVQEDPEFEGLSERILELVRVDQTLSAENRDKIAALIREYYQAEG